MNCIISIDLEKYSALKQLSTECGTDTNRFYSYINKAFIVEDNTSEIVPSKKFQEWWESKGYKDSINLNKGSGITMSLRIKKFYNETVPSVKSSANKKHNLESKLRNYPSASARDTAKRHVANKILQVHLHDVLTNDIEAQNKIKLKKAILVVNDIIKHSELSNEAKLNLIKELKTKTTIQEIKDLLKQAGVNSRFNYEDGNKTYYTNIVIAGFSNILYKRLITRNPNLGKSINEFFADTTWIKTATKELGEKNITTQDATLIALVDELLDNKKVSQFMDEVSFDSRLGKLRMTSNEMYATEDEIKAIDSISDTGEENSPEDGVPTNDTYDTSFMAFDRSGTYTTVMTHIGDTLKDYFNTLPRLNSGINENGNFTDVNTANDIGLPDTMNAEECVSMLVHRTNKNSVKDMIASIEQIANDMPEFASFYKLAYDMKNNDIFAYQVYRVFSKTAISMIQTVLENGVSVSKVMNYSTDRRQALRLEYQNSVKFGALGTDIVSSRNALNAIRQKFADSPKLLKAKLNNEEFRDEIINAIYNILRNYYYNIERYNISRFVINHKNDKGVVDIQNNINILISAIDDTINGSEETIDNYYENQEAINEVYEYNRQCKLEERYEDVFDVTPLYYTDYLSNQTKAAAIKLSDLLLDYSIVKTELNVINPEGNQSSAVINNSYITYMLNVLKDSVALKKYGTNKLASHQYRFSNILIDRDDEFSGEHIYGLFKVSDTGEVTPTPYAASILQQHLFAGASNYDSNVNELYDAMSNSDYIGTTFINFYNRANDLVSNTLAEDSKYTLANYFMRVPSDAPKNFIISAPKYSINGLFSIKNEKELNIKLNNAAETLIHVYDNNGVEQTVNLDDENNLGDVIQVADYDQLYDIITCNTNSKLNVYKAKVKTKLKQGETLKGNILFECSIGDEHTLVAVSGDYKNGQLTNIEYKGLVSYEGSTLLSNDFIEHVKNIKRKEFEKNGDIEYSVNDKHVIFSQLRNVIRQELVDYANALDFLFIFDSKGLIQKYTEKEAEAIGHKELANKPKFNERVIINPDGTVDARSIAGAYDNYHFKNSTKNGKKVGNIFEIDKNGHYKLLGNVFHSDRLTIYDNKTKQLINYGERIFEHALFNPLYGGSTKNDYLHIVRNADDKIIDVDTSNGLDKVIDDVITEFCIAYSQRALDNLYKNENVITGNVAISHDSAAELALNYKLMYINFGEIFEGDSKFYKNSQDELKRAKESQDSGVPYGIVDYQDMIEDARTPINSILNTTPFANGHRVVMYNKFRAVTCANTIKTGETIGEFSEYTDDKGIIRYKLIKSGALVEHLVDVFTKETDSEGKRVYTKDQAEQKAYKLLYGFRNTTINDAQSYITFDEWIRRISARGQLNKYKSLIDKVLSGEPINADDCDEFIQVQKNFYYDQAMHPSSGVFAPRQIKNAEFVLVPQLIEGTELEVVADFMEKAGIDQLNTEETDKAGKTRVIEVFDTKTGAVIDNITDEYGKSIENSGYAQSVGASIQYYSYNTLYTQQETPQHVDSENKFGTQLAKKIIDNIKPEFDINGNPTGLYAYKVKYFNLFGYNIKDSYNKLMRELKILGDDDMIKLKITSDGECVLEGMDYKVFYKRLREEVARLGLDSNMMDYVTPKKIRNENGDEIVTSVTIMPNFMSMVGQKLESIAQSIFNNNVTNQKLPGFHAAQITNVGFKRLGDNIKTAKTSSNLMYHPEGKNYIEVMLPTSVFSFMRTKEDGSVKTKEELLTEIQEAGLDMIIGYRIPTEGKQSACNMKIVGFLDDAYGSTIVVPDDWVSQTGSDFDIDSVYGINYNTYIDSKGHIRKVKYVSRENVRFDDYLSYLKRESVDLRYKDKESVKTALKDIEKDFNDLFNSLMAFENKAFNDLENVLGEDLFKDLKKAIIDDANKRKQKSQSDFAEQLEYQKGLVEFYYEYAGNDINNPSEELKAYINSVDDILDFLENNKEDKIKEKQKVFDAIREKAIKAGVLTYEQYLEELSINNGAKVNSREARSNGIIECIEKILSDDNSLEENISRSNYDAILEALDTCMSGDESSRRKARSATDIFDQAEYMEEAGAGRKLKARSVLRDNFCSICNTVRPIIDDKYAIKVAYNSNVLAVDTAINRFGTANTDANTGKTIVTHNKFGWSFDNKNAVDMILTAYSSQTTAHILDAIKAGFVPNVNDYTFSVYKMFPDLGVDYTTAIAFIMQNGITRIVNVYNSTKSMYIRDRRNPIEEAIREIAKECGFDISDYTNINVVLSNILADDRCVTYFKQWFGKDARITMKSNRLGYFVYDADSLIEHLETPVEESDDDKRIENAMYDLGIILQYARLQEAAANIQSISRCCTTDKNSAKTSIFETNKFVDDIKNLLGLTHEGIVKSDNDTDITDIDKAPVDICCLSATNKEGEYVNFIEAVYPGLDKGIESFLNADDNPGSYPTIYYYLKYSTIPSIIINRSLFVTQNAAFRNKVLELSDALSDKNKLLEKDYKDYEKYIINYLYTNGYNFITLPYGYDATNSDNIEQIIEAEKDRIFGYYAKLNPTVTVEFNGRKHVVDFQIGNPANPTNEEVEEFKKLTPAQKIVYIKKNFRDLGLFGYIDVSLYNQRSGKFASAGAQLIEFNGLSKNIEDVRTDFKEAFGSTNPLVRLAAADIVKYAFYVEGYKLRKNGISKIIPNSILYTSKENGGTGIVDYINEKISNIGNILGTNNAILDNYIRSHSDIKQISSTKVKKSKNIYELSRYKQIIRLSTTADKANKDYGLIEKYHIGTFVTNGKSTYLKLNKYVKLRFDNNEILYKIKQSGDGNHVYLVPLNKLERNEYSLFSTNSDNNIFYRQEYYDALIEQFETDAKNSTYESDTDYSFNMEHLNIADTKTNVELKVNPSKSKKSKMRIGDTLDFDETHIGHNAHIGAINALKDKIEKHFYRDKLTKELITTHIGLESYFPDIEAGIAASQIVDVPIIDGDKVTVMTLRIYRMPQRTINKNINNVIANNLKPNQRFKEFIDNFKSSLEGNNENRVKKVVTPVYSISIYNAPNLNNSNFRKSALTETTPVDVAANIIRGMHNAFQNVNNVDCFDVTNEWRKKGIKIDKNVISEHLEEIIKTGAIYTDKIRESIMGDLQFFWVDPDDDTNYLKMTDPKVGKLIRTNEEARNKFLNVMLSASGVVKQCSSISNLDISSTDFKIKEYLDKIKDNVKWIENNSDLKEAYKFYINEYLSSKSTNKLVQDDIINLFNNFYSTSFITGWIGDMQENTNTIMQVLTKSVMSDIRAKEMQGMQRQREFRAMVASIINKAKEEGKPIDWNHIIDNSGRFIQKYKEELIADMDKHRETIAKAKEDFGEYSPEHLKAVLEYNKWKVAHINQELDDNYYLRRNAIEEEVMFGEEIKDPFTGKVIGRKNNGHIKALSEYKKLQVRRNELLRKAAIDALDSDGEKELETIKRKINDIINPYSGEFLKSERDELFGFSPTNDDSIYSYQAYEAMDRYLKKIKQLNEDYYEYSTDEAFYQKLEQNLSIIRKEEARTPEGILIKSRATLNLNPEYVRAKEWIDRNAIFVLNEKESEEIRQARNYLSKHTNGYSAYKRVVKKRDAIDANGVVNGRKLTAEDIEAIKKETEFQYNVTNSNLASFEPLISNARADGKIYTHEFYRGFSNGSTKGRSNEWYNKIKEINKVLLPYYNSDNNRIEFERIPDTEEGRAILNNLARLYEELEDIRLRDADGSKNTSGSIKKFIKENVIFNVGMGDEIFQRERAIAATKSKSYLNAWINANVMLVYNHETESMEAAPNPYIYGKPRPKPEVEDKYLDKEKMHALKVLNDAYYTDNTTYYYETFNEMYAKGREEFSEWYNNNHVYNPYTHKMEPLRCWTTRRYRNDSKNDGEYKPSFTATYSRPKSDKLNKEFKKNLGNAENYKIGTGYDNDVYKNVNPNEEILRNYLQETLMSLANTADSRRYFEKGFLPSQFDKNNVDKSLSYWVKQAGNVIGWVEGQTGKDSYYTDLYYHRDIVKPMPMLNMLNQVTSATIKEANPKQENESDEAYEARINKITKERNKEAHEKAINKDWVSVISDFIGAAAHYNAVQDNKLTLYLGREIVDNIEHFERKYGFFGDYKKDRLNTDGDEELNYRTVKDTNIVNQYETWMRRILYEQWKEPNEKFTKFASKIQSITSAKYMMMNFRGGIANVTVGESNIIAEALAKNYFGTKTWSLGLHTYNCSIINYFADAYSPYASSLASAIVKWMDIVDYDVANEKSTIVEATAEQRMKKFIDFQYAPNNFGEHMMRNTVMFSLMYSHRIYEELNEETGKMEVKFKNLSEVISDCAKKALMSVLDDAGKEEFKQFVDDIKKDANKTRDYAHYRKDIINEFVRRNLTKEQQKEYVKTRKLLEKNSEEEFENDTLHPTIYSQFELGEDKMLSIKKDSVLGRYDASNNTEGVHKYTVSPAFKLLADFKGRIISVNNEIHGVYDRLGQAAVESKWFGSLLMQYHKHIYPGILKRWRREGGYNEARGDIMKGSYTSLIDFVSIPFRDAKAKGELSDNEATALQSLQNIFKELIKFNTNLRLNWQILPDFEKANIRKNLGDALGIMAAVCTAIALRCVADDEEDGVIYNLALYEADRLYSESVQFNPFGAVAEAKKLWSTPIAAQSVIENLIQTAGLVSKWLIEGDEYDPYYHTGRYAGENKLKVYIEKQIPIYRGIKSSFVDIVESNNYYRMGDNISNKPIIKNIVELTNSKD